MPLEIGVRLTMPLRKIKVIANSSSEQLAPKIQKDAEGNTP